MLVINFLRGNCRIVIYEFFLALVVGQCGFNKHNFS
jgi:hypothetical protein